MNATNPNTGHGATDVTADASAPPSSSTGRSSGRKRGKRTPRSRRPRAVVLPDLLTAAVERNPEATALVCGSAVVSYRALDGKSSRLARVLVDAGVEVDDFVGVALPRSVESVTSVWGVAKSGAAIVPFDPGYPAERLERMVLDSGVRIGVTTSEFVGRLPADVQWIVLDDPQTEELLGSTSGDPVSAVDRVGRLRSESAAYVVYTSGSTGVPKGVVVTQAGLANFAVEQRDRYELGPDSRTLHFASPSFDASMLELLLAVGASSTMVVAEPSVFGGVELWKLLSSERVSHAFVTPAALASVDPGGLPDLRVVVVGGEAWSPELLTRWAVERGDGAGVRQFFNGYGPTETTIMSNISRALLPGGDISIGAPIRGMSAAVLDGRLRPVVGGAKGELYLWGPGVARGYHGRGELTAGRFVANPLVDDGSRMYRTGDIVRRVPDSYDIEYVGRSDFQVKVRGFRIELGEIDAVVTSHPDVEFAVTVARSGEQGVAGATVLVTYVLATTGSDLDVALVRGWVKERLPRHMVPAQVVVLDELPLTPVGKLDRAALPEPGSAVHEFRAPLSATEKAVAAVIEDVLNIQKVGLDDDFFELGGNSLIATQVAARLQSALGRTVAVRTLFETSSIEALAAAVVSASETAGRPELVRFDRPEHIPLSLAQQRYWFLNQFDTTSAVDNIPIAVRLSGDLDVAALQAAVADVVARHEVLRTSYPNGPDGPSQLVRPTAHAVPDLTPVPVDSGDVAARVREAVTTGFDVTQAPPLFVRLHEIGGAGCHDGREYVLVIVVHHISADGSSLSVLVRDVMTAYSSRAAGQAPPWQSLPVQYADFALWQREVLGAETDPHSLLNAQITYWKDHLRGVAPVTDLPVDRPRPAQQSFAGAAVRTSLSADVHRGLISLAHRHNASLFMVVHTALAALIGRMSNSNDVVLGTPMAGRGDEAMDGLIGMFVNTLVLRTGVRPTDSFVDALAGVREVDLAAFSNSDVPFERIVEAVNPPRSAAYGPLFQVGFSFQNFAQESLELPGLVVRPVEFESNIAKSDLHFTITEQRDGGSESSFGVELAYATGLFDDETAQSTLDRFVRFLGAVAEDGQVRVGDIELMTADEQRAMVHSADRTAHPVDDTATLVSLFGRSVENAPDDDAVFADGERLTFRQFDSRVNATARYLISLGVGPESAVALAVPRGLDMLVWMYAIVAAGAAYVPLDSSHPVDRNAYIIDTAGPVLIVTGPGESGEWLSGVPTVSVDTMDVAEFSGDVLRDDEQLTPLSPDNTAYIIFTSGSTGKPKGVAVSHRAIVNQLEWLSTHFGTGRGDTVLIHTAVTFDLSVWEYWGALVAGSAVVVAEPRPTPDPAYLLDLMRAEGVTTVGLVPALLNTLLTQGHGELPPSVERVYSIGEELSADLGQWFRERNGGTLANLYGPTEAAVSVTVHEVTAEDTGTVPIGRPEWNTGVLVLDDRMNLVPAGIGGDLYLSGVQLARGYVSRMDLTAQRFVADPFGRDGSRMYRTGDRARWNRNGELEYLGRSDEQVKVRGYRIELGEIESVFRRHPDLTEVAVALREDGTLGDRLVAYVVPVEGRTVDRSSLLASVAAGLPSYMIPAAVVVLDRLPLNPSGKVDRRALPDPVFEKVQYTAPSTETEALVVTVFAESLGADKVGVNDDFFELGGNSMSAVQMVGKLSAAVHRDVPLPWVFGSSTPAELASRIDRDPIVADSSGPLDILVTLREGSAEQALFCFHPITGTAWAFAGLAPHIDPDRPIHGLQSPALSGVSSLPESVEDWADLYLHEIRRAQPAGPYHLVGWSMGGVLAHAVAVRLRDLGESVDTLAVMDATIGSIEGRTTAVPTMADLVGDFGGDTDRDLATIDVQDFVDLAATLPPPFDSLTRDRVDVIVNGIQHSAGVLATYRPTFFDGDLLYFTAEMDDPSGHAGVSTWSDAAAAERTVNVPVSTSHWKMASPSSLDQIGPILNKWIHGGH
ncbi:amino acid adenylation domain-containing protein [Rhodococcoides yunnanense]|uniref:amino acid adenylation domain-containing protein n=1 Tax=Rhodococcoides yunnanense TaxID=278209 RepID=UPI000A0521C2|nr:non-ribosomal peptide synthetase [Rhodococcus yunnanensis]